jgi:hypothetical protein
MSPKTLLSGSLAGSISGKKRLSSVTQRIRWLLFLTYDSFFQSGSDLSSCVRGSDRRFSRERVDRFGGWFGVCFVDNFSEALDMPRTTGATTFDLEDREAGMLAIILHGGSCLKAAAAIEQQTGRRKIPVSTLRLWKTQHADRYRELQLEVAPKVADVIAAEAEETAILAAEGERLAIQRTIETIDELPAKDAAGAARNMAVVKGIQIEKAGLLRGRPTSIVESRSPDAILTSIAKKLGFSVDSTAVEEPEQIEESTDK